METVKVQANKDNSVNIKLYSVDWVNNEAVKKYFEGTWWVTKEGDVWLLSKAEIDEIENPTLDWFYN